MKYMFQQGGEVPQESTDFFNQYLDQLQQSSAQPTQSDDAQPQPEDTETDYIKNLRAYADEQPEENNTTLLQQLSAHVERLEKELNFHQQSLEEQQNNIDWFASEDGQDYTRTKYDTQTNNNVPVFAAPTIPMNVIQQRQLQVESGEYSNAVSSKGARGAYQFMPATWEQYKPYAGAQPTDTQAAEQAYTHYMHDLTSQFQGDQRKAVAAYNYGPGNVTKLINKHGSAWEEFLPTETKNYLNNVFRNIETKNNTVDIQDVNKQLLNVVGSVSTQFPGLVVTSGTDGQHTKNSAHYDGEAVDIGANSSDQQAYAAFKQSLPILKQKYGVKYLDEGNHIHLSLSSKGKL